MKKAYLVTASFATRVVLDDKASEQDILEAAAIKIAEKATYEFKENLEGIKEDKECPYDPEFDNQNK